jgi:hypothetical protein
LPESGLVFRADFVRVSVKVKPRVARSMAMRKRLVSCPGLVVFPISRQVDFPPRRVDFDFQIRGLDCFWFGVALGVVAGETAGAGGEAAGAAASAESLLIGRLCSLRRQVTKSKLHCAIDRFGNTLSLSTHA